MKLVAMGDIHAHSFKDYSKTLEVGWDDNTGRYVKVDSEQFNGRVIAMNSRLFNIVSALSDVRGYCLDNAINTCLMAGDLFHSRGSVETVVFNSVYKVFERFKQDNIEVIMIAGNHDQFDSSPVPENSLYTFNQICKVVSVPETIDLIDKDTGEIIKLCALPYSKDKLMLKKYLDKFVEDTKDDTGSDRILMAHLGLSGSLIGSANYVISDEWNINDLNERYFKYTVLGHYHKPQFVTEGCFYTGSLLQNNFNDEGDKHGFMVLDTDFRWDVQQVALDYPEFITITKDNVETFSAEQLAKNYIRVASNATDADEVMGALDSVISEAAYAYEEDAFNQIRVEVEKDYDGDNRSDISISMSLTEVIQVYAKENAADSDDVKALIEKGLDIVSKVGIEEN